MNTFCIGDRRIGPGLPTFVIAEIGVNHDGSLARALELVEIAAECGADAVKLQIFRASELLHESAQFAEYQKDRVAADNPVEMLRRYELRTDQIRRIAVQARERGLIPLATPFSPGDVEVIESLDLPAIKIASPDVVNRPLLARAAQFRRPLLISTGAATLDEVKRTSRWLAEWNADYSLLHCVSSYPTPSAEANLCWITELANHFDVPIGYSDHTPEVDCGAYAVSAGACIIERHLTYDRGAAGPDHSASSDPAQFAEYVRLIRRAQTLRGQSGKRVLEIEQDVRRVSRQSLVALRDLNSGEILSEDDLTVRRPGTGIAAADIEHVVGRRVLCPLPRGSMLTWEMLSASQAA